MMRINVFLSSAGEGGQADRKRHVLRCFYDGLIATGENAGLVDQPGYQPCDVAVVLGGRPLAAHRAAESCREEIFARHRGEFVFIETPLIGRQV
ncbi:MAG: hypothetical protein U1E45_25010, partial [Geminicoccaceae bacterium]